MTVFFLQAPAAGPAGGGSMMWIMLIAMFVIMYFFMIRPQNKKQKEFLLSGCVLQIKNTFWSILKQININLLAI